MFVKEYIEGRKEIFSALCVKYNVQKLYAFGSSTRSTFNKTASDIDLLVDINKKDSLLRGQLLLDL